MTSPPPPPTPIPYYLIFGQSLMKIEELSTRARKWWKWPFQFFEWFSFLWPILLIFFAKWLGLTHLITPEGWHSNFWLHLFINTPTWNGATDIQAMTLKLKRMFLLWHSLRCCINLGAMEVRFSTWCKLQKLPFPSSVENQVKMSALSILSEDNRNLGVPA